MHQQAWRQNLRGGAAGSSLTGLAPKVKPEAAGFAGAAAPKPPKLGLAAVLTVAGGFAAAGAGAAAAAAAGAAELSLILLASEM